MNRLLQAVWVAIALSVPVPSSAEEKPGVHFDVSIPGAHPEQIERDFLNVVEPYLQARAGVSQVRSIASQGQATVEVVFEQTPMCVEVASIAAFLARAVPQGGLPPKQRPGNPRCEQ